MIRPCFLVIDREYPGTISTRKLVIETAKFNVVTAYSGQEALEMLRRFPNLHGIVLDAQIRDITCEELTAKFREINPEIPIIVISGGNSDHCSDIGLRLETYNPKDLLDILKSLYPKQTEQIMQQDESAL